MLTQALGRYEPALRFALRLAAMTAATFTVLLAIGLLAVRFWIWPSLPQWQPQLLATAQSALSGQGLTLQLGKVTADWESWYRPRLQVHQLGLVKADGEPVMSVEKVEATLGPRALAMLWHWQPIFSEIRLVNPIVHAERAASGEIRIAGFVLGAATPDAQGLDWLLRQGRLRLDGGEMTWSDVARNKSVRLTDVTLALNNLGHRHAWALQARPPAALGENFILQGNFRHALGSEPSAIENWKGEAFVQFDRVDLAQLFGFVRLPDDAPLKVNSGQGAMRAWVHLNASVLEDLTVDLDLTDASLQWGAKRSPLTLQQLKGRVFTRISGQKQEVTLSDVTLRSSQLADVTTIPSASLRMEQTSEPTGLVAEVSAKSIELAAAMWLVDRLPLPERWKKPLNDISPRGRLTDLHLAWRESADTVTRFAVETKFDQLAAAAGAQRPGFSALSGSLRAKEDGGELAISGGPSVLVFPGVFENPELRLDRTEAQLSWVSKNILEADGKTTHPQVSVKIKKLNLANADAAVEVAGSYDWPGQGMGTAALDGRVLRADPTKIYRYVPKRVSLDTRTWLKESLLASRPYSASFALHGPMEKFPFRDATSGDRFFVKAEADNASLRPAPNWPVMTNIRADVVFERQQFRIKTRGAKIGELALSNVEGRIDDMEAAHPILAIDGTVSGDFQRLIDTVNQSPIQARLHEVTADMKAKGQASLLLGLKIDLDNSDRSLTTGKLSLNRGTVRFSANVPEISVASADIGFDQNGLRDVQVLGHVLGGPVRAVSRPAATPADAFVIALEGQAAAPELEHWAEQALGLTLKDSLTGSTHYTGSLESRAGVTQVRVASSLEGLGSSLFGPLKKGPREDWGLTIEMTRRDQSPGGTAAPTAAAHSSNAGPSWRIKANHQAINATISPSPVSANETLIDLDSKNIAGQFKWIAAQTAQAHAAEKGPKGFRSSAATLQGRLSRLWLDKPQAADENGTDNSTDALAQDWPNVDLMVEDFRVGARAWGALEVQASPATTARSWQILRFVIRNPEAELTGKGQWAMLTPAGRVPRRSRTTLDIDLQIKNGGNFLGRAGYPNMVRNANGNIEGQLHWPGSPLEFSGPALNGALSVNIQQGQFLKAEPGIARLIGVLNLQSLPSRIKLDFRDVFSEGFTFDRIRGDLQFLNGQISTQNLRLLGVQASVLLEGSADLKNETQNLRVLVLPEVNAGLATLGYALVNPAIGLGAFLAQFVLRNPVRELLAYEYRVTGEWADPVVQQVKRDARSEPADPKANDKPVAPK